MIGSVNSFNPLTFAVNSALARQQNAAASPGASLDTGTSTVGSSAEDDFKKWMTMSPAERMEETWLRAHGLSKEKLAAMSPKDREAVMKQMQDEIAQQLKDQAKKKAAVDILA